VPALLLGTVVAACSSPKTGELRYIEDDRYAVRSPGPVRAVATGRGCGATERHAEVQARRLAEFNLRTVTGAARYNIDHELVGREPQPDGTICVTVEARATPPGE